MRIHILTATAILLLPAVSSAALKSVPSYAEPSISPDRSEIAFVSGGDIWTVPSKGGEARLLVAHPATESRPLYSPDGKRLAFNSTRTGNGDIYVLTFATGEVKRITYSDAADNLSGWSRDGQWLYFDTNANDINQSADVFRVGASGGTPLEVSRDRFYSEFRAAPSPDGSQIALVAKGFSNLQWWRHGHSHLDESEIWLKGIAEGSPYKQLVAEDAKQGWPMWSPDGKEVFYTSDRTGAENVFWISCTGGPSRQITHFEDGRLLWPSIGYDGREIVFERNFAIWKLDTKSGVAAPVPIELRGASSTPAVTHMSLNQFTEMALSPDGKKVALVAHGDVFAASATDGGDAQRITHTASPEAEVEWETDSNRLVYLSSRNGHQQVFEYDLTKDAEQQLTGTDEDDSGLALSPDGKLLALVRGEHSLHMLNLKTKADKEIASGDLQSPVLGWSPDSRFIAYTSIGAKSFRNVSVAGVDGSGAGQPISFLANGETADRIAWSPDGKYLLFETAQRSEPSQIARVDLIPHLSKLREEQFRELFRDKEPAPELPVKSSPEKKEPSSGADVELASKGGKDDQKKKTEPTRVIFEGIRQRLGFLAIGLDASDPVISPDGKTLVFLAATGNQRNLYSYSLDELAAEPSTARQLTSTNTPKSVPYFTADSKTIFFLDGGRVVSMPVETHVPKAIAVTAAMDVNFEADKVAAFEQGWAILNKRYYDPKFHGQNWAKLRETFEPYIAGCRTPDEMRRVTNLMIGELNSSHSGIAAPRGAANATPFTPAATPVGRLGLRFERSPYEAGKGLIVREIIPLSPAALAGRIKVGDRLASVDGEAIGPDTNLDSLLEGKVNHRVMLGIGVGGSTSKTEDVVLHPVSFASEAGLLYRAWVEANRAYVQKVSRGKLGYVHISDMSQQSLNQLYIDLDVENQTKQGVVVDIRDNNGGFVNEYALDVFTRKNYLVMTPRGSKPAPARPFLGQRALGLPTVLVTNQGSLSDAEDFTEGYRALHLGRVVGEPTAGWIIYTGGANLVDGSIIRTPFIRVQATNGEDMELHPRPVDVLVERKAGEWLEGKDTQLDRAVKELLATTAEHP